MPQGLVPAFDSFFGIAGAKPGDVHCWFYVTTLLCGQLPVYLFFCCGPAHGSPSFVWAYDLWGCGQATSMLAPGLLMTKKNRYHMTNKVRSFCPVPPSMLPPEISRHVRARMVRAQSACACARSFSLLPRERRVPQCGRTAAPFSGHNRASSGWSALTPCPLSEKKNKYSAVR